MTTWEITAMPLYGTATLNGDVLSYNPDSDYEGTDFIVYRSIVDGIPQKERRICITVSAIEGPKSWRPIDPECVKNAGENTGYKKYNNLQEYYIFTGTATGIVKPNADLDPDYVAPIYDTGACPIP